MSLRSRSPLIGLCLALLALSMGAVSADQATDADLLRLRNQAKQAAPVVSSADESKIGERKALLKPKPAVTGKPIPSDLRQLRNNIRRDSEPLMRMDPLAWSQERLKGFKALFDGRDLQGWEAVAASPNQWLAANGILQCSAGEKSWLRSSVTSDNFILRFQWKMMKPQGKAGIVVRASKDGSPWPDEGNQVKMSDAPDVGTLSVSGLIVKPLQGRLNPSPQWNDFEIDANGSYMAVQLNGKTVMKTNSAPLQFGYVGFEGSGDSFQVQNVRIKELGWTPLLKGGDLTGWKADSPGHWTRETDGSLVCASDSGGAIDTVGTYSDYDLRFDWRVEDQKAVGDACYRGSDNEKAAARFWDDPAGSGGAEGYATDSNQTASVQKAASPSRRADNPSGAWNHFDVSVRGSMVSVWLNGASVLRNVTLPGMPAKGSIGFKARGGPVWIRKVEVRDLSAPAGK